ncbi:MAG TPA: aminodeoxychorismate/anthranilate synthase component II [Candidatus Saccharimonadales bacterium]|nr:aminodeoxychorismate/anthranilate synthase component II [Candidatus Saccharimonadales bacterium]HSW98061.1 aminodeoxychorismate/anthranilate synthase component II [Candidatus Saccharimonadales bacterium]
MKVLLLDNYDSFTFNLYQYAGALLQEKNKRFMLDVLRNDEVSIKEIQQKQYDRIIISPGPGDASDTKYFGVCSEVILTLGKTIPVLGVCLGMQGIAHYFGGKVIRAKAPMHGKTSSITHDGKGVFQHLPQHIEVMRYHSLIVEKHSLPDCLEITAVSQDTNEIMGLRHKDYPIEGIQFHPESFATEGGMDIVGNFLGTQ